MSVALRLNEIEEAVADDAFLSMSKLRDLLVRRQSDTRHIDKAIASLEQACRGQGK